MTTPDANGETQPLTKRQQEVYEYISQNINFYGPTVREIAAALGIKSRRLKRRATSVAASELAAGLP
jgi:DNA-binding CsgD family transcriptional regulator